MGINIKNKHKARKIHARSSAVHSFGMSSIGILYVPIRSVSSCRLLKDVHCCWHRLLSHHPTDDMGPMRRVVMAGRFGTISVKDGMSEEEKEKERDHG